MDHQAIILAAGCSRRLEHLTRETPKALLSVGGKPIMHRTLEALEAMGFTDVVMIVGYLKEVFYREIGDTYGSLKIRYVESPDYETTGHGWSLYQTKPVWEKEKKPVLMIHGDVVYDPGILQMTMDAPAVDAIAADDHYTLKTNDEVLVCGSKQKVSRIQKVYESPVDVLGELVGINKWSPAFVEQYFGFMETFYKEHGNNHNWEPVADAFLKETSFPVVPVLTGGKKWVNVNYEEDLKEADVIAKGL